MDFVEGAMLLAIGFVSTLIALEIVYRMGRAIGKRGEISSLAQHGKLKMLFFIKHKGIVFSFISQSRSLYLFFMDRQKRALSHTVDYHINAER
jgi:hypothetical protein